MSIELSPLDEIRVVDMSTIFMGPGCTSMLGRWDADVVKAEAPPGDVLRYIGYVKTGMGTVSRNANRGKCSIVLDVR